MGDLEWQLLESNPSGSIPISVASGEPDGVVVVRVVVLVLVVPVVLDGDAEVVLLTDAIGLLFS